MFSLPRACSVCGVRPAWSLALAITLGATGLSAAEAPAPAPLDDVKRDLKELKQADKPDLNPGMVSGIAAPGFQAPDSSNPPPASGVPSPLATKENKRASSSNWLVDAVELQRPGAQKKRTSVASAKKNGVAEPLDPADPSFLLKLYLAQHPSDRSSEGTLLNPGEPDSRKEEPNGLFNDYVARWMTPHDLELLGWHQEAPGAGSFSFHPPTAATPPGGQSPAPTNPYLEGAGGGLPGPGAPVAGALLRPPAASLGPTWSDPGPTVTHPASSASATPASHPSPPANPADEKKYFPQLNRF